MKVLVVESEPHASAAAVAQLESRGHHVERCHDPEDGSLGFPCTALTRGRCPLEAGDVDVALTVRGSPRSRPTALEDGVTCALRRHVPVVVAGRTSPNPFERRHVSVANQDIVGACERAATGRQVQHEAVAQRALDWTLDHRGIPVEATYAEVRRRLGGLHVTLFVPDETPTAVREMAVVRVAGAVRAFDAHARSIDVSCEVTP